MTNLKILRATDIFVDSNLNVTGTNLIKSNLNVSGAGRISNNIEILNNTTLKDNLNVTGQFNIKTNLNVSGLTTLNNNLTVSGASTVHSNLNLIGSAIVGSKIQADGDVTINNTLTNFKESTIGGNLDIIDGNLQISGTMNTDGNLEINSDLSVSSAVTNSYGLLNVSGNTVLNSGLDITGNLNITSNLNIGRNFTFNTGEINNLTIVKSKLEVTGNITSSNLTVRGNCLANNTITVDSDLTVNDFLNTLSTETVELNSINVNVDVDILNSASISKKSINNGLFTVNNNFISDIPMNITNNGVFNDTLTILGNRNIIGNSLLNVSGAINLNNDITAQNMTIYSNLNVTGNVTSSSNLEIQSQVTGNNNLNVTGNVTINNNLNITGNTTLSKNLNVSGNLIVGNDMFGLENVITNSSYEVDIGDNSFTMNSNTINTEGQSNYIVSIEKSTAGPYTINNIIYDGNNTNLIIPDETDLSLQTHNELYTVNTGRFVYIKGNNADNKNIDGIYLINNSVTFQSGNPKTISEPEESPRYIYLENNLSTFNNISEVEGIFKSGNEITKLDNTPLELNQINSEYNLSIYFVRLNILKINNMGKVKTMSGDSILSTSINSNVVIPFTINDFIGVNRIKNTFETIELTDTNNTFTLRRKITEISDSVIQDVDITKNQILLPYTDDILNGSQFKIINSSNNIINVGLVSDSIDNTNGPILVHSNFHITLTKANNSWWIL